VGALTTAGSVIPRSVDAEDVVADRRRYRPDSRHLVVVVVAANQSDSSGSIEASSTSSIAGSRDDWLEAVCEPGRFSNGGGVSRDAVGSGFCPAAVKSGNPNASIFIYQYDSDFLMRNDLQGLHMKHYASVDQGGLITVFAVNSSTDLAALEPLTAFGFAVEDVPTR
jgi:hypothetical protein